MTCRICGSLNYNTKDCCPTPIETGLSIPRDDFEKLMYQLWNVNEPEKIPYAIVRDFYSDWMNGSPETAEHYLTVTVKG
jgi:hypothetical protein